NARAWRPAEKWHDEKRSYNLRGRKPMGPTGPRVTTSAPQRCDCASPSRQHRGPRNFFLFLPMNTQFRRDVESILDVIGWNADNSAVVKCPGFARHASGGSPAMFYPSPTPHIF